MQIDADRLAISILREASRFLGLGEVRHDSAWNDPRVPEHDYALAGELCKLLRPAPWEDGWTYSAAFVEAIVDASLRALEVSEICVKRWHKFMTPDAVTSASNFEARDALGEKPDRGAIWFGRYGATSEGEAGVVSAASGKSMAVIEAAVYGEEGQEQTRILTQVRGISGTNGLKTVGFVTPEALLAILEG